MSIQQISQEHLDALHPALRAIVDAEIRLGNQIIETHAGWPKDGSIFVKLELPFLTDTSQVLPDIVYREINDPHWWKAEFMHEPSAHVLACGFSH